MSQIIFTKGVSGFARNIQPDSALLSRFEQAIARLAEAEGWQVKTASARLCHSFAYQVLLHEPTGQARLVFCNRVAPLVALAQVVNWRGDSLPENRFISDERWAAWLDDQGFAVLAQALLEQKLDADIPESAALVQQLDDLEFAEFAYWEPKTVADIIFNDWGKR